MDNHIKVWSLREHQHVLAASDAWRGGGDRVFPTGHVTMPVFSTEVCGGGWSRWAGGLTEATWKRPIPAPCLLPCSPFPPPPNTTTTTRGRCLPALPT